jgi:hypothetical protein
MGFASERTCASALQMSAFGVKRTWLPPNLFEIIDVSRVFRGRLPDQPPSRTQHRLTAVAAGAFLYFGRVKLAENHKN